MHPLEQMRVGKGINRKLLSRMSGISYPTIRRTEKYENTPQQATLQILAETLGCAVEDISPQERLESEPPNRRKELAQFLVEHGFDAGAVFHFYEEASQDGYITSIPLPEPSEFEDPTLAAMDTIQKQWKWLEMVWDEFNIYGKK